MLAKQTLQLEPNLHFILLWLLLLLLLWEIGFLEVLARAGLEPQSFKYQPLK
jgi:hypothetical protein